MAHVLIAPDGTVASVDILSGPRDLRENFVAAIRQWKYKPYLVHGVAVPVDTTIGVNICFGG